MENEKPKVDQLIDHVEEYFQTRQELSKLVAAEKSSVVISSLIANLILFFVFLLVFIFGSIALAYCISQYFGKPFSGFLVVASVYLLVGIILVMKKDKWLKIPMENAIIKSFFKKDGHE